MERRRNLICAWLREWEAELKEIGRNLHLIEQICRKLRKEKTEEIIAKELEEPLENVERICAAVMQCGLDADAMEIYEQMQNEILQS